MGKRFPINRRSIEYINRVLDGAYSLDIHFRDGVVFNSMCTQALDESITAYEKFIEANLGNPYLYRGTKRLETAIIDELKGLYHLKGGYGSLISGGTEGNITALWIARNFTKKKKILIAKSAHFSVLKAIDLLSLEPVYVNMDRNFKMDLNDLEYKLSIHGKDTAAVVAVAGTTELGVIDPIPDISNEIAGRTMLHVDAAFGGFVIPFLEHLKDTRFDFGVDGVTSMIVDPHKMGMAPVPSGILLIRKKDTLDSIKKPSPYLTTEYSYSLSGTRASGSVASTYTSIHRLGSTWYRKIAERCWKNTRYLEQRLKEEQFEMVVEPTINILAVKVNNPVKWQRAMMKKGFYISKINEPSALRIIVMPHIKKWHIDRLVEVLSKVKKIM